MLIKHWWFCLTVFAFFAGNPALAAKPDHAGGGSGPKGGGSTDLILELGAAPTVVEYGAETVLSWVSAGAKSCEATGAWSGRKPLEGYEQVTITADASFTMICRQKKRSVSRTVAVSVEPSSVPAPTPTATLNSDQDTVALNGYATLSWSSEHATACLATGSAWEGELGTSGSRTVGPLTTTSVFALQCSGQGGVASASTQVSVNEPAPDPAPTVQLSANPTVVAYEGFSTLSWSVTNATQCTAGGGWVGEVRLSGTIAVGPITGSKTYALTCDGPGGSGYAAVSIELEDSAPIDVSSPGTVGDGRLDAIVEAIRSDHDLPALAVVVTRYGQVAEAAAEGVRAVGSDDPVTLADRWHLISLTKGLTGTLAGTQVEQGVIAWHTTPLDVWPELAQTIQPQYREVTLAQLLTHASGMPKSTSIPSMSKVYDSAAGTVSEKRLLWAQEILQYSTPEASVGTYHYTNAGYIVAGAMLEAVTGASWETLLRENVLTPLGMNDTGYGAPGPNQPFGHRTTGGSLEPVPPGPGADNPLAMGPALSAHASLTDYAAFMLAHLAGANGGSNIVSGDMYDYLHGAQMSNGYAIGWFAWSDRTLSHSGYNSKWRARVRVIPKLDVGIFVATNANNSDAEAAATVVLELLVDRAAATP